MNYDDMNKHQKAEFDDVIYTPNGLTFSVGANFCRLCGKMFKYYDMDRICKECKKETKQSEPTNRQHSRTENSTS